MTVYQTIHYYCPHCDKEQFLFSWKPLLTNKWRWRRCRRILLLDAQGVGGVWAIGLWSVPVIWLLTAFVFASVAFLGRLEDFVPTMIGGVIRAGPMFAGAGFFIFAIVGFFIGYVYALKHGNH